MTFVLTIIFLFFYFIRPQDFIAQMQGDRVVMLTLGLAAAGWAIKMVILKKSLIRKELDVFILGMWLAAVLSTFTVRWTKYTLDILVNFGKIVLVYFIIRDIVDSPSKFKVCVRIIVLFVAVVALFGVLQYYGYDLTGVGYHPGTRIIGHQIITVKRIRGVGIFDTNQLAHLMGLFLPLAFGLFLSERYPLLKILAAAAMVLYGWCVLLTHSRGGELAFLVASGLLLVLRGRLGKKLIGLLLVGLLVGLFLINSPVLGTIFEFKDDPSAMARIQSWYVGSQLFKEHPIIGVGIFRFTEYHKRVSHNGFVELVAETGILGLFCWMGILYLIFRQLIRLGELASLAGKHYWIGVFSSCLAVAFMQFIVASLFSADIFDFTIYIIIGLVAGLTTIVYQEGLFGKDKVEKLKFRPKEILNVFGLMVLVFIFWKAMMVIGLS